MIFNKVKWKDRQIELQNDKDHTMTRMKLTKAYLVRIFTNSIIENSYHDAIKPRPFTLAIISFRSDPHLVEDRTLHTDHRTGSSKSDTSDKRTWRDDRAHEIESRKKTTSAAESYNKHLIQ